MAEAATDAARRLLSQAVADHIFPGAVAEVGRSTGRLWRTSVGCLSFDEHAAPAIDSTVFDLASLTKPLATTALALALMARGAMRLDERVSECFDEWRGDDREDVTVADLLEHTAGLPARLMDQPPRGRREFEHEICGTPLEYTPRTKSLYSDLDFILLGFLVSDRGGSPLRAQFATLCEAVMDLEPASAREGAVLEFGPVARAAASVAPTVPLEDDPRRGAVLTGTVHDHYAHLLGGEAGHAGLFGNVSGVGSLARVVLRGRLGDRRVDAVVPRELFMRAVQRSLVPGSSRALGWDTMLPTSSCGTRMSASAFGHVGFTGTSLWIDPENDRYFVLLSNRACGGGTVAQMRDLRRAFHDVLAGF